MTPYLPKSGLAKAMLLLLLGVLFMNAFASGYRFGADLATHDHPAPPSGTTGS